MIINRYCTQISNEEVLQRASGVDGCFASELRPFAGSCGRGNGSMSSVKSEEFLDQLGRC
jgi:hypothetical protein